MGLFKSLISSGNVVIQQNGNNTVHNVNSSGSGTGYKIDVRKEETGADMLVVQAENISVTMNTVQSNASVVRLTGEADSGDFDVSVSDGLFIVKTPKAYSGKNLKIEVDVPERIEKVAVINSNAKIEATLSAPKINMITTNAGIDLVLCGDKNIEANVVSENGAIYVDLGGKIFEPVNVETSNAKVEKPSQGSGNSSRGTVKLAAKTANASIKIV